MSNIGKVLVGLFVALAILATPVGRALLMIIALPSGWDDFIFYGIGIAFLVFFIVGLVNGKVSISLGRLWQWLKE